MSDDLTSDFDRARKVAKATAEKETDILMGQISGSKAGLIERIPEVSFEHKKKEAERKQRESNYRDTLLAESHNAYMNQLAADLAQLEAGFIAMDGEEWREKLALRILGADDIPQIKEGESIEDYRERLEPLLIAQLLNLDGSIKKEYENHPDLAVYAQWAQKQHHLNMAKGYVQELESPSTTPDRQQEILEELEQRANTETQVFADRQAIVESAVHSEIKDTVDQSYDETLQSEEKESSHSFLKI